MRRRQFLLGSSAVFASGGLFTGAGAFSSTTANREAQIAVVGDENAYLGLREEEMDDGEMLFETEMPRTAPETFDVTNQTAGSVDIVIELRDGNLAFDDADSGTGVGSVSIDDDKLSISGMEPGAKVSDVTIEIPGRSEEPVSDTLSFDVTGEDGSLQIDTERALELKPEELDATIKFNGAITATFEITNISSVEHSSVTATANGDKTTLRNKKENIYQIDGNITCTGDTTSVTVQGKTTGGVEFSGTASGVKCSEGGG